MRDRESTWEHDSDHEHDWWEIRSNGGQYKG